MRRNPSDFKRRCVDDVNYLKKNIEDRDSRDQIVRSIWWEKYNFLKNNAWFSYMIVNRWIRDRDFRIQKSAWDTPVDEYVDWVKGGCKGRFSRGGGVGASTGMPCSGPEGTQGINNKLENDLQGVNTTPVREIGSYGYVEYGYGKWIRLVEKEGDYGRFLALESGETVAGKKDGKVVTDTRTKSWFSLPMDPAVIKEVSDFMLQAADGMEKFAVPVSKQPEEG